MFTSITLDDDQYMASSCNNASDTTDPSPSKSKSYSVCKHAKYLRDDPNPVNSSSERLNWQRLRVDGAMAMAELTPWPLAAATTRSTAAQLSAQTQVLS